MTWGHIFAAWVVGIFCGAALAQNDDEDIAIILGVLIVLCLVAAFGKYLL